MTPPLISVIIPAFNAQHTLTYAIESVFRQDAAMEVVVVDDGSTDATGELCTALETKVRYIRQDNQGVAAARNTGLGNVTGELVTFLDADDEWPDGSQSALLRALETNTSWDGVQGRVAAFGDSGASMQDAEIIGTPWHCPSLASALFHRGVFERVGQFDPTLKVAEDLDWFIRAREAGCTIGQVDLVTLRYRMHANSLTRGLDPRQKNLMLVLKRSLDRRRSAAAANRSA